MYGNEALTINQWRDVQFTNSSQACTLMSNTISAGMVDGPMGIICNGNDVIKQFNFDPVKSFDITYLVLGPDTISWVFLNFYYFRAIYFATFCCWLP